MVYDVELVEKAFGPDEGFTVLVNDAAGQPDDLTAYSSVLLVISDMRYTSPPERSHLAGSAEFAVDSLGVAKYKPTSTNPVPDKGKYYFQIFRKVPSNTDKPTQKWSLLTTQGVPQS